MPRIIMVKQHCIRCAGQYRKRGKKGRKREKERKGEREREGGRKEERREEKKGSIRYMASKEKSKIFII